MLPEDYLELIEATEGLSVGRMAILGLSQVYEIVMSDWNYYLVVEISSLGMLGVRAHGTDGEIYFLDYDGSPPWPKLGHSLARAASDLLTASRRGGRN